MNPSNGSFDLLFSFGKALLNTVKFTKKTLKRSFKLVYMNGVDFFEIFVKFGCAWQ